MPDNSSPPDDYTYAWESVGDGYACAFCTSYKPQTHAWRAHSDKYGDVYVCPRHLHHIQTGFRGERHAVWLALRAKKIKRLSQRVEALEDVRNDRPL